MQSRDANGFAKTNAGRQLHMDMIEENMLNTTKVEEDIDVGYEVVVANVSWSTKPFRAMKKEGELPT